MKSLYKNKAALAGLALLAACGGTELETAQQELGEKKAELTEIKAEIAELEAKIAELDTTQADNLRQEQLVTALPINATTFEHFVEVRGDVESDRNVSVSAETSGTIERVLVTEGQEVRAGQLLVQIDDAVIRNNIAEIQTQYTLAKDLYERQQRLREQNIGTEVQLLQAKTNMESLRNRLSTLNSQLAFTQVKAPFSGTVERVNARVGEAAMPAMPLLQLVSLKDMTITADVSEAYIGKFKVGDAVEVSFPSLNKTITSKLTAVGQVINPNNRTFKVEVDLPANADYVRPNLMAVLLIKDFSQAEAIAIPTNLIQRDNKGEYVYLIAQGPDGRQVKKQHIGIGVSYQGETLVTQGLQAGDVLVNEGFRQVNDGSLVKVLPDETTAAAN
jgi:RND family efflux transporter MFP subunit